MDLTSFAVNNGFVEAKLRGYRSAFLKEEQYNQVKNFHNLEEFAQYLMSETDYGEYIDTTAVSINSLKAAMKKKLSDELNFIEINASNEVCKFIFYIRATYMIENVLNLLDGIKLGNDFKRLKAAIDPIGFFQELNSIEAAASDLPQLYETVLIDTPISDFFSVYLQKHANERKNFNEVQTFFKEEKPEKVRSNLKKIYIEKFFQYCQGLNQISKENMTRILSVESDFKTIQIVYNSLEDAKNERSSLRETLCPTVGPLYPLNYALLKDAQTVEQIRDGLKGFENYKRLLAEVPEPSKKEEVSGKTLEDVMYEAEVKELVLAFDEQANLAVLYAYVKLKEQEIRNLVWIAEMISRQLDKSHPLWKKIIIPFASDSL